MGRMENPLYHPRPERWLTWRFGLRTLFVVVTIVCLWLGWNVRLVQHRKAMRAQIVASGGAFHNTPPVGEPHNWGDAQEWRTEQDGGVRSLSFIRRILGDTEALQIEFPRIATAQDLEAASAFSEAHVMGVSRFVVPDVEIAEPNDESGPTDESSPFK